MYFNLKSTSVSKDDKVDVIKECYDGQTYLS